MKEPQHIYAYKDNEFYDEFISIALASRTLIIPQDTIRRILRGERKRPHKKGYWFSYTPLTQEEIDKIPIPPIKKTQKQKIKQHNDNTCTMRVDDQIYKIDCQNPTVTYIPKTREEKINALKKLLNKILQDRWLIIPKYLATLEKQHIRELLDSLL